MLQGCYIFSQIVKFFRGMVWGRVVWEFTSLNDVWISGGGCCVLEIDGTEWVSVSLLEVDGTEWMSVSLLEIVSLFLR